MFLLMVHEALRFKVSWPLEDKQPATIARACLKGWMVYFGSPKVICSDQEGGIQSDDFAQVCDRFSIHRKFAGSDKSGQHTITGLPEKHIFLIKPVSLKTEQQLRAQGLMDILSPDDVAVEVIMSQNFILEHGGFTPAQGLMGHNSRGFYEIETESIVAHSGIFDNRPDFSEAYLRNLLVAKQCTLRAIIDARIAQANNSKPMKVFL